MVSILSGLDNILVSVVAVWITTLNTGVTLRWMHSQESDLVNIQLHLLVFLQFLCCKKPQYHLQSQRWEPTASHLDDTWLETKWHSHSFYQTRRNKTLHKLTASLHPKLFAAQDVMQQILHVERTQVHQALGSFLSCRGTAGFIQGRCTVKWSFFTTRERSLLFLTRAVQAASQLSGHHLHDEAHPQPQHVPKQRRLGAHVHGQIDHDLLSDEPAERLHSNEKWVSERCEGGESERFTWVRTATLMSWPLAS